MMPEGGGQPWIPGSGGNIYDSEENPMAHYNRALIKVELPEKVEKQINSLDMNWTSKTKSLVKMLLNKLGSQELVLAKLSDEVRQRALMDFEVECIKVAALAGTMDSSTSDFVILMTLIRDHALIVFSRSEDWWERILQATFIRRIEERLDSFGGPPSRKPGVMEQLVGAAKTPEQK